MAQRQEGTEHVRQNIRGTTSGDASKVQNGVKVAGGNKQKMRCPYQVWRLPNTETQNLFSFLLLNWKSEDLGNQIRAKSSAG